MGPKGVFFWCWWGLGLFVACNYDETPAKRQPAFEEQDTNTAMAPEDLSNLETPPDDDPNTPYGLTVAVPPATGCCGFPLKVKPQLDFNTGGRQFGASRSSGRKHAGCDLLAKVGTPIYAIDDGKIIDVSPFYLGTDAIVVLHKGGTGGLKKDYVVRYGETRANSLAPGLKINAEVKRGQHIGYVGKLQGLNFAMVHFELFSGSEKGNLSQSSGPFQRRKDLLDPTPHIKEWIKIFNPK